MNRGNSRIQKWKPRGAARGGGPKTRGAQRTIQAVSVLQCWAQKAAQEQQRARQEAASMPNDAVMLDDSFDDEPSTSGSPQQSERVLCQNPKTTIEKRGAKKNALCVITSDALLKEKGADPLAIKQLHFSIGEITREWEREAVKIAVAHNTAISIPYDTSGAHVAATILYNFLNWFPGSKCLCTVPKHEQAVILRERCQAVGIAPDEFTEIDNVTAFKKLKPHQVGRLIVGNPLSLTKICEKSSEFASSLCCVVFIFESPSETPNKYKKLVDLLINEVPEKLFRTVIIVPRHFTSQRKGAALTNRQILITKLGLSEWIQFGPSDPSFRVHHVSPRVGVEYWDNREAAYDEATTWTGIWREATRNILCSLVRDFSHPVPSIEPDELFHVHWAPILEAAKAQSNSTELLAVSAQFVVEAYKNLCLGGPRVFFLYCYHRIHSASSDSLHLQTTIASDEELNTVYEAIRSNYDYLAENPYDVGYNKRSLESHPKWMQLRKSVEDFLLTGRPIKGAILCENAWNARVAAESLNGMGVGSAIPVTIVHAVINDTLVEDAFRPFHKTLQSIPPMFQRTNITTIAIIRLDLPLVAGVLDKIAGEFPAFVISVDRGSLCWLPLHNTEHTAMLSKRYEKLRPTDGHLPEEFALNDTAARYEAVSIFDKFDFDYHASALCLDMEKCEVREYFYEPSETSRDATNDYILSSTERAAYDEMTLGSTPKPTRTRSVIGTLTDDALYWNKLDHSLFGDAASSETSQLMLKQMQDEDFSLFPGEFAYNEKADVNEKRDQIDSLLGQLEPAFH